MLFKAYRGCHDTNKFCTPYGAPDLFRVKILDNSQEKNLFASAPFPTEFVNRYSTQINKEHAFHIFAFFEMIFLWISKIFDVL